MGLLVELGTPAATLDAGVLEEKERKLFALLEGLGRVVVAYSGGTDSAYLAWAARRVLDDNALAVTAVSPSLPESHRRDAEEFARRFGLQHEWLETREFENPLFVENNPDRCFHCKGDFFALLKELAGARGFPHIVYGVNLDDLGDYRPGQKAAEQHGVRAPLMEAGLSKAEIRELSRRAGLPTWDRPAAACLSSRIPYGTPITVERVKTVEAGEEALRGLGFRQFRVRFHGDLVRIEIAPEELPRALDAAMAARLVELFKPLGFHYVTLDLEGYRQGAMNEALGRERR
ncbi:MAG: ATP-dependent sacrificial sulfur transferase LarE [Acidobacteria bacterium]|nr:ATP-dependent sacrificial sulfur transferase LarE [Acidobacteriota bacterium]